MDVRSEVHAMIQLIIGQKGFLEPSAYRVIAIHPARRENVADRVPDILRLPGRAKHLGVGRPSLTL
jgi:hypothetical protein